MITFSQYTRKLGMTENTPPRKTPNLGEVVEATLVHYSSGATVPTDSSLRRRQIAFVKEVTRVLPLIAQRTGISPQDILLFSSPHEDRGDGRLPPIPLSRPRLFQDIPQQRRGRTTLTRPSSEPSVVEQPQEITTQPMTLETLKAMSPQERASTIREIRRRARISKERFAAMNHIAPQTLREIENLVNTDPSEALLQDICNGLTIVQAEIVRREERFLESIANMSSREIVYAFIKKMGITYKEFGDKIRKSESWVDKTIGRKIRTLTLANILEICDAYGLKDDDPIKIRLLEQIYLEENVRQISRRSLND